MEMVKRGNERVLKARLSDARFFFEEDTKEPLDRKVEALKEVIFQAQLGTSYEKVLRFKELALYLARKFRPDLEGKVERAAMLCKADLVTGMVGEFPTLQGVVGTIFPLLLVTAYRPNPLGILSVSRTNWIPLWGVSALD
jgi:glycyl-tRNA synthetase beta chain